jgi:ring-1,2-phenylacetyl-CoA epoxidase subunit PaaE
MPTFYPLTVAAVRRETRNAVVLSLEVPDEFKAGFRFKQGQYLTFRRVIDGDEVRRSYSICSATQDAELRVGIKKVDGGVFSTWANERLEVGSQLEAMAPAGSFHVPLDAENHRHYAGFACGSGITPILSILKTTLYTEPHSRFTLFYGNRASSTIMFREALEDLKNQCLERLNLVHILSREQQDIELLDGHIDLEKCTHLFRHWLDVKTVDTAFICGPQDMMLAVSEALRDHGLDRTRIKFELFATDAARQIKRKRTKAPAASRAARCAATVVIDGRARSFELEKNQQTVLEAGLEEGLELPYACKAGVCSTCRAMLMDGEVDMNVNFALEDYEVDRGYILTCQSYPVTDKVIVDFDL